MKALSVFELVHYLKGQLDFDDNIQNIVVCGEISNFTSHYSGHLYFSLKDDKARISCVMFKGNASKILFKPKNGDKVIVKANTSIYEGSGQLQLYVTEMKIDGIGELYLKYELLKKRLSEEGLFDESHKKPKPQYPERIAVLVGDKSAAMSDIKTCFNRRWPIAMVDYHTVLVQGNGSSNDIISTLLKVDEMNYDAIILARGGGSIEDLWSFNDERLAYTIYNLKTFIITGIGHEQDFTIADFVADLRAPTPTASVELITPDIRKLENELREYRRRLITLYNTEISNRLIYIDYLYHRLINNTHLQISMKKQRLELAKRKLIGFKSEIINIKSVLNGYKTRMIFASRQKINDNIYSVDILKRRLDDSLNNSIKIKRNLLHRLEILLKAYNAETTLKRGYSIAYINGNIIRSINDVRQDDEFTVKLSDGKIKAEVKEIQNG